MTPLRKDQIDFLVALHSHSEHRTIGGTTFVWREYDVEKLVRSVEKIHGIVEELDLIAMAED